MENKERQKLLTKLRNKYRLVILNDDTFEEKLSLKLSRLNVFLLLGFSAIFLVGATTLIIAYTPLREYIPGYSSTQLKEKAYELALTTDSLEAQLEMNRIYLVNLRRIVEGKPPLPLSDTTLGDSTVEVALNSEITKADSAMRKYVEEEERFALPPASYANQRLSTLSFFKPVEGLLVTRYNPSEGHYGVDLVADAREVIKACQEGVVIFAEWTVETGYVIIVQHRDQFISAYKHNSALLKKQGELVKTGEPIAIIGSTGELSTGPHLHFELWFNGNPVNPQNYLAF